MELLVSIAVMIIISTVIASNQKQFGAGAALKNIVNNLSLSLRQAQIYGVSVKQLAPSSSQAYTTTGFNAGYGVHFSIAPSYPTGDSSSYLFFLDTKPSALVAPNGLYLGDMNCNPIGGNPPSECLDKVVLGQGHTITDLCSLESGTEVCTHEQLDITFVRPAVEAKIIFNNNGVLMSTACIEVSSTDGKKNSVVVYTTGQVSVRGTSCIDAL